MNFKLAKSLVSARPSVRVACCSRVHASAFHSPSSSPTLSLFLEPLDEPLQPLAAARLEELVDVESLSPSSSPSPFATTTAIAPPTEPSLSPSLPFKFLGEEQAHQAIESARLKMGSPGLPTADLSPILASFARINRRPELIAMAMDMYHILKSKAALTEDIYNAILMIMVNNMSGLDCYKLFLILLEQVPASSELVRMRAYSLHHEMKQTGFRIHASTMTQLFFRLSYYEAFPRLLSEALDRMSQLGLPTSPSLYVSCIFQLVRLNHPQLASFYARVRSLGIESPLMLHYMVSYYLRTGHIELARRYRDEFLQSYLDDPAMHLRLLKAFCFHLYFKEAIEIYDLFVARFCHPLHSAADAHFRSINGLLLFFLNRVGLAHSAAQDILARVLDPASGQPHCPEHYSLLLPLYLGHPSELSQLLQRCAASTEFMLADPKTLANITTSYLMVNQADLPVLKSLDLLIAHFRLDAVPVAFDAAAESTVPLALFHLVEPLDKRLAWLLLSCQHFSASLHYRLCRWLWRRFAHAALYQLYKLARAPSAATQFVISSHSFQYLLMAAARFQDWYAVHELISHARKSKLIFHANRFPLAQILFDSFHEIDQTLRHARVFGFHEPLDHFFELLTRYFTPSSATEQAEPESSMRNEPRRLCSSLALPNEGWLFSNAIQLALSQSGSGPHVLTLERVKELSSLAAQIGLLTISELKKGLGAICPPDARLVMSALLSAPPSLKALLQKDLDMRSRAKKEEVIHLERKPRTH